MGGGLGAKHPEDARRPVTLQGFARALGRDVVEGGRGDRRPRRAIDAPPLGVIPDGVRVVQRQQQDLDGRRVVRVGDRVLQPVAAVWGAPAAPAERRGPAPLCRGSWCAPDCCDGLQYSVTNTYDASAVKVLLLALYNPDAIGNDAQGWRIDGATRTTITAPALDDVAPECTRKPLQSDRPPRILGMLGAEAAAQGAPQGVPAVS